MMYVNCKDAFGKMCTPVWNAPFYIC